MTAVLTGGARPRFAIVRFPGSNCDQDAFFMAKDVLECPVEYVWHAETSLDGFDVVVLPGGFSYGDYLRTGAVARFANIMGAVRDHAEAGKLVIGICNGFQILCEANLLPGALVRNIDCRFLCKWTSLRVENAETAFTNRCREGQRLKIAITHGEGRYVCDDATLERLRSNKQILFRYVDDAGEPSPAGNANGSVDNIAGIANESFNVLGMMPHPERATEKILGSADGRLIFDSMIAALALR